MNEQRKRIDWPARSTARPVSGPARRFSRRSSSMRCGGASAVRPRAASKLSKRRPFSGARARMPRAFGVQQRERCRQYERGRRPSQRALERSPAHQPARRPARAAAQAQVRTYQAGARRSPPQAFRRGKNSSADPSSSIASAHTEHVRARTRDRRPLHGFDVTERGVHIPRASTQVIIHTCTDKSPMPPRLGP